MAETYAYPYPSYGGLQSRCLPSPAVPESGPASSPEQAPTPVVGQSQPPRHVAVILDGNRRWAERHGVPLREAYRCGAARVHDLLTWCDQDRIPYLTVWALSRENLRRDPVTLAPLAEAMVDGLQQMAVSRRWRIRVIGDLELLGSPLAADLRAIEAQTQDATGTVLNVAVAYSGRADIAHAAATLIHRHQVQDLDAIAVERLLCRYLSTAGQPDIDLVIRTSGEERLSGFMPWQAAQAELYFTPVLWPDFGLSEFRAALHSYAQRSRRCGL